MKQTVLFSIFIFLILFLGACRSTRHVPEGQYLLTGVKVKIEDKSISEDNVLSLIKQKPNRKILRILRFHLAVYNFSKSGKNRKWKNKIAEIVGEEPVIYDEFQTQKSSKQIVKYLNNKGYYHAICQPDTYTVGKKKVKLEYKISPNTLMLIKSIDYKIADTTIRELVLQDTSKSSIKPNLGFDIDKLQEERLRIIQVLKNNGYYYFTKENIEFEADTTSFPNYSTVSLIIQPDTSKLKNSLEKYTVNDVLYYVGYDPKLALEKGNSYFSEFDSMQYQGKFFFYNKKLMYHPKVINRYTSIFKDKTYSISDVNATYKGLTSLRTFRLVNIMFADTGSDISINENKLNCFIFLSHLPKQSYQLEVEGTHSSGNLGLGGNILYQNRNLFRRAEIFDIKLSGAIERQTVVVEENDEQIQEYLPFNSIELGGESKIYFHTFLFPFTSEKFTSTYFPKTILSSSYNFQQRPDFSRNISNISFGYAWTGKKSTIKHYFNPIELNYVKLPFISRKFLNTIRGTFLESSYTDHLVIQSSYSYIINDHKVFNTKDRYFLRTVFESAGNIINGINHLANSTITEEGNYEILNTPYAQFLKAEIDFRYYKALWFNQKVVYRFFTGVGYPYGNLKVLPFEKRYFSGGANGIRAWAVRTLGPGSYIQSDGLIPNQTGDIKLEANLEYRFKLFWVVEGALFADAGNIWDMYEQEERIGGNFKFENFINDIALGTGLGFRFDFSFLVFRLDWGLKLRDPSMELGKRWIITDGKLSGADHAFNVGIGYPF